MRRPSAALFLLVILVAVVASITGTEIRQSRNLELLRKMTLSEKLTFMAGSTGPYTGNVPALERLNIPAVKMQDGPQGFRTYDEVGGYGSSTAWPSAMTIASSFDEDLTYRWAAAMAEEFKGKGANMFLGPGIGIARVPNAGRNFEYLCGEDPQLGSVLVQQVVKGLQNNGIIANAKHFVNNEIEKNRDTMSAEVSERVRFELYYPPFQAAVDAGVLSVMCSYNRINDVYACENPDTLSHLRDSMGFKGWVVSDWGATHSTSPAVRAGLDQEMPYADFFSSAKIEAAIANGNLTVADVDTSVLRILYAMDQIGLFERAPEGDPMANVTSDAHNALAREIAAKSTVLVKNENHILPLKVDELGSCIAVIGDQTVISGDGSGSVTPPYVITPTQGISSVLSGTSTEVIYNDGKDLASVKALAQQCGYTIVLGTINSCEGIDRDNLSLGNGQDDLISTVASVNAKTIVALNIPGAILMPWVNSVAAVVVSWMPGQEAGNALADVLFGKVNPSARLVVTMPNKENEVGFSKEQYPGVGSPFPEASYTEELLIGYRWYDAMQVEPLFPFGHGLSYSFFKYNDLKVKTVSDSSKLRSTGKLDRPVAVAEFLLKNIGEVEGDEVVQLYLSFPASAGEPPKQLRRFAKVHLVPNEDKVVTFELNARDVSVWDSTTHSWSVVAGTFGIQIGASSRDIRVSGQFII